MDPAAPSPRPVVTTLPAYRTSASIESPRFRASSNELSDAPSEHVVRAVTEAARSGNRYPAPYGSDLVAALAEHFDVDPANIGVDGGSHTLLNHLLLAYVAPDARVVYSWPSFEAYPISVAATGGAPVPVPNRADGSHDLEAILAELDANTPVVILCNPNNPTGTAFGQDALVDFIRRAPAETLIVVDEAYVEFLDHSVLEGYDSVSLLAEHPNVLVLRTFSKSYGLAGFRVGYCLAHPHVVAALRAVQPTFPVSQPAVVAAIAALGDAEHGQATIDAVTIERRNVTAGMRSLGLPVVDSHANFVWLPLGAGSRAFAERCFEQGIVVRVFGDDGVRITVGQPGLAEALVQAVHG